MNRGGDCPATNAEQVRSLRHGEVLRISCRSSISFHRLSAAKAELLKHSLSTFTDDDPPRVVVTGCPSCRRRFGSINQLMDHLADEVLPRILRKSFQVANE